MAKPNHDPRQFMPAAIHISIFDKTLLFPKTGAVTLGEGAYRIDGSRPDRIRPVGTGVRVCAMVALVYCRGGYHPPGQYRQEFGRKEKQ